MFDKTASPELNLEVIFVHLPQLVYADILF